MVAKWKKSLNDAMNPTFFEIFSDTRKSLSSRAITVALHKLWLFPLKSLPAKYPCTKDPYILAIGPKKK